MIQDGYCNDESNNHDCNFDGDDCCYTCVNKDFCKHCLCFNEHDLGGINPLIGDGICHDGLNNVHCNFDGGDCCGSCVNTGLPWQSWPKDTINIFVPTFWRPILNVLDFQQSGMIVIELIRTVQALF